MKLNLLNLVVIAIILYALLGTNLIESFWGWGYPHYGVYYGGWRRPYRRWNRRWRGWWPYRRHYRYGWW